ncbi:transposase [Solidesulfovibrio sp.]|uniref:transposase n=1 Tax=Solidesulfovibrio sp. TaxID=2910990 RepID=UPI0038B4F728
MPTRPGCAKAIGRNGYKIHAATDSRDGFVRGGHATPADRSDTEEFVTVLDEVGIRAGESVYADKGYSEPQTCWLPVGWVILPFFFA